MSDFSICSTIYDYPAVYGKPQTHPPDSSAETVPKEITCDQSTAMKRSESDASLSTESSEKKPPALTSKKRSHGLISCSSMRCTSTNLPEETQEYPSLESLSIYSYLSTLDDDSSEFQLRTMGAEAQYLVLKRYRFPTETQENETSTEQSQAEIEGKHEQKFSFTETGFKEGVMAVTATTKLEDENREELIMPEQSQAEIEGKHEQKFSLTETEFKKILMTAIAKANLSKEELMMAFTTVLDEYKEKGVMTANKLLEDNDEADKENQSELFSSRPNTSMVEITNSSGRFESA